MYFKVCFLDTQNNFLYFPIVFIFSISDINDYRFCVVFLGHHYLLEQGEISQININKLIKYQENFHEDSHKILVYQ